MYLQRTREWLSLALIALLPFHALAVTVLTRITAGPGHAPLSFLTFWKEGLLAVIMVLSAVEWGTSKEKKFDLLDGLIVALMVVGVATSYTLPVTNIIFGLKYDFVPLIAFLVLRRVPWSADFISKVTSILLIVGAVVAGYGIISLLLPQSFFTWLGYSDLHSLYQPNAPLAPYQQIGGTTLRRIQSVMSGPNQLRLWLLLPFTVGVVAVLGNNVRSAQRAVVSLIVCMIALLLTFSRAAWIGAFVIILCTLFISGKKKMTAACAGGAVILGVVSAVAFPSVVLRMASSRDHWERPMAAMNTMIEHPLGLGLGSAGPASNRVSDTCVTLEAGADASWAAVHPQLCVFVGGTQVQPVGSTCNCPFLPENWYLQLGVEMGWAGMILFVALVLGVLWRLKRLSDQWSVVSGQTAHCSLLTFLGVSIAALFLHAWEDSAVAYTAWMILAMFVPPRSPET